MNSRTVTVGPGHLGAGGLRANRLMGAPTLVGDASRFYKLELDR